MRHRFPLPWIACLVAAGCASTAEPQSPIAGHPSGDDPPRLPVAAPSSPPPRQSTMETTMTTAEASEHIAAVFGQLGFRGPMGQPMVTNPDVFGASVPAQTADGHRVDAACEWISQFRTRVRLTSDLDADKFDFVLDRVRAAVGWAATQP